MNYSPVDQGFQAILQQVLPLSSAQTHRISQIGVAMLLAKSTCLSSIASFVKATTNQDSRIRRITRLLDARFVTQDLAYQPAIREVLKNHNSKVWHLMIDRSTLWDSKVDLVTVALHCRKRVIPLMWEFVPFGGACQEVYIDLVQRCAQLIPPTQRVIFHGDTEFGRVVMIFALRELNWDFILGQSSHVHIRCKGEQQSRPLSSLPVPHHGTFLLPDIELTSKHLLGGLNLLAFREPKHNGIHRKREFLYLVTSLPLSTSLRRVGRRRWGIEPFHRDLKSAGFQLPTSRLRSPKRLASIVILAALAYLGLMLVFLNWES